MESASERPDRRVAITSIFGRPKDRSTWSAAPASIAAMLEKHGMEVTGVDMSAGRSAYAVGGLLHLLKRQGSLRYSEAIARGSFLRRKRARRIIRQLKQSAIRRVLHTGTLDFMPVPCSDDVEHYLYCDSTWHLSLRYRPDSSLYTSRAIKAFDAMEAAAYQSCRHIFTFGAYVRDDIIEHYGVPADKVTAVGSGCGDAPPYRGEKDYRNGELIFISKHLFREKGGDLLLEAFRLAQAHNPNLKLTIVGGASGGKMVLPPRTTVVPFLEREKLISLIRNASLLVQPMLNDPWGQVYLEALLARTPVIGLNRNGLPEITDQGRHGLLVDEATPDALACAILDAISDPERLARMGDSGQAHVLSHYSWEHAGEMIAQVLMTSPCVAGSTLDPSVKQLNREKHGAENKAAGERHSKDSQPATA